MLLIFSSINDISTDDIQIWLNHYGIKNIRLNENYFIRSFEISKNKCELAFNGFKIDLNHFDRFLYRRPGGTMPYLLSNNTSQIAYSDYLLEFEFQTVLEFLNKKIKSHKHLNSVFDYKHQKLDYLKNAEELGIEVPEWIVSGNINSVKQFLEAKHKVITKALNMPYVKIPSQNGVFEMNYNTSMVTAQDIELFTKAEPTWKLLPSFFQEYIEKKFEVRTFYLDKKFYSMAIFSQQSEKTKVDYRNYDREKPNRAIPFKLPDALETKLIRLIERSGLTSCSVDFIYSTDHKFYFLEINPIGQFKWVSQNCNYYIEKEIAEYYL